MSRRMFLSYARENHAEVAEVEKRSEKLGFDVWLDQELRGGQAWWDEILDQIRRCDVFVAIVSGASLNSRACARERAYAEALGKPVLPVAIERLSMALPTDLVSLHVVDYTPENPESTFALASALAGTPPPAPLPDPLPPPPDIPLSYLVRLVDLADSPHELTRREQLEMLDDLEPGLRATDPEEREGAWHVLRVLAARPDLYADTSRRIDRLRADYPAPDAGGTPARAREEAAPTGAAAAPADGERASTPRPQPRDVLPPEERAHRPEPATTGSAAASAMTGTPTPVLARSSAAQGRGVPLGRSAEPSSPAPGRQPPARARRRRGRLVALLLLALVPAAVWLLWPRPTGDGAESGDGETEIAPLEYAADLGDVDLGAQKRQDAETPLDSSAPGPFTLAPDDGAPFSFELSPTCTEDPATCRIGVLFSPTAEGAVAGTARVVDGAGRTVAVLTASGTGTKPVVETTAAIRPNLTVFTLARDSSTVVVGATERRTIRVWNQPGAGVGPSRGGTMTAVLDGPVVLRAVESTRGAPPCTQVARTEAECRVGTLDVDDRQDFVVELVPQEPGEITLSMRIEPVEEGVRPFSTSFTYTAVPPESPTPSPTPEPLPTRGERPPVDGGILAPSG